jgi:formylglycine-generating enzyme required for sulfatase activity
VKRGNAWLGALLLLDYSGMHVGVARAATHRCAPPDRSEVRIPAGTFRMGSTQFHDEEGPVRSMRVATFWIDRFDVTNAQFAKFVASTHYVTDAERKPDRKEYPEIPADKLDAGGAVFTPPPDGSPSQDDGDWWQFVAHADWRHPVGPTSTIVGHDNEPVVQVSYRDALAYARWSGRQLPTEVEYEYAARGGLDGKTYAWGDELTSGGQWMANVWQGHFPNRNTTEDGYGGIAPVGCFPPNGYGLYDMVGNVWKWTSSPYSHAASTAALPEARIVRTIKGGSFLCALNYCRRFRPAARQPEESGFSSMHIGFRTVSHY